MTKIIFADISGLSEKDFNELYALADSDRKRKTDLYVFMRDKKLSVMSDLCLNYLIATEFVYDDRFLCKGYSNNGKPFFLFYPKLHYNISHSVNKCLVGISDRADIGLDIECIAEHDRPDYLKYITGMFREDELITVEQGENLLYKSLVLWTQKEALFKLHGTGILKQILCRPLTKCERRRINSYISDNYIFSVANILEEVAYWDATKIGVRNMIKYVKDWKESKKSIDYSPSNT